MRPDRYGATLDINRLHLGLDELRCAKQRPDRVDRVPRLQDSRPRLKQQWAHQKIIVAADERDLNRWIVSGELLQVNGGVDPAKPAPNDYNSFRLRLHVSSFG